MIAHVPSREQAHVAQASIRQPRTKKEALKPILEHRNLHRPMQKKTLNHIALKNLNDLLESLLKHQELAKHDESRMRDISKQISDVQNNIIELRQKMEPIPHE